MKRVWSFSTVALVVFAAAIVGLVLIAPVEGLSDQGATHVVAASTVSYRPPLPSPRPGTIGLGGCGDPRVPMTHTNAWSAAGVRNEKWMSALVCAGAYRKDVSIGYFLIVRNRCPHCSTSFDSAWVYRSGALRITDAPMREEGSAHVWDAHIRFESERGMVGYLDLKDDSMHPFTLR